MPTPLTHLEGNLRPLVRLVWPVLIENTLHLLVQYVDLWLTGNYLRDEAYLAAVTLMVYVMWFVFNLFALVAQGATAVIARYVGAGNYRQASRAANQAITIGLVWSMALVVIGLLAAEPVVHLLQLEGAAADAAVQYLRILVWALPAVMLEEVGFASLRGAGDTLTGLIVMSIVNLINIAVSSSLLLGLGPLPEMGWIGLAIGTATGHAVGGLIVLILLARGRAGLRLRWVRMRPRSEMIRRILRIGIPGGIDSLMIVACHLWYVSIINQLGNMATAAHGVGVQIEALAYMPGAAFQIAAATLAGQYLGARDYASARRSVLLACAVGAGVMITAGAVIYLAAVPLSAFFLGGPDSEVVPITARLLRVVAFSMPALAVGMILQGALRGAGDTRWPLLFTLVGMLGLRIPLAYWLAHDSVTLLGGMFEFDGWGLGVLGAWYAMFVDVVVRCLLVVTRFRHGGWQRIEV
ncbi:MAG: MATE family efflux transporter [Pirellulales bacterium]